MLNQPTRALLFFFQGSWAIFYSRAFFALRARILERAISPKKGSGGRCCNPPLTTYPWDTVGPVQNGKRPESRKWGKMENQMENRPELEGGENGPEMGGTMENPLENPFPNLFFWPFSPLSSLGRFSIWFSIFPPFWLSGLFPFFTGPTGSQTYPVVRA